MKKILTLALAALLALTLVGCSNSTTTTTGGTETGSSEAGLKNTLTLVYTSDADQLDYLETNKATDFEVVANLVDGLLGYDRYGHIVGNLAEEWSSNEDQTVWTFKLRQGVKWVTNTGEEYAEVTADDFVAGLQHAADFKGGTIYLLQGSNPEDPNQGLVNFNSYILGQCDFSEVGVKAVDDYTVEYTFNQPMPYFESMTTYAAVYPVNRTFLESQGEGCKLGSPDVEACDFGTTSPDSILYNGAFLLSANDAKSQIKFTKNQSYYMADQVYIDEVTWLYGGEDQDVYSDITSFENGTIDQTSLRPVWEDFDSYVEKYADYYYETLPNQSIFNINFNYNRLVYENTGHTSEEDMANTRAAILNENFRKAVMAAYDRVAYLEVQVPHNMAVEMLRNFNGSPEIVATSDGRTYGDLVTEAYQELTGTDISLADAQDPFLSKEAALEYIEAAKAEGISFPVSLDCAYISGADQVYVQRAQSMKQSIEENTDGQIVINLIPEDIDTYYNNQYYNENWATQDYDINTFSGWSPDYADPKTYVDIYSTSGGSYMRTVGLPLDADDTAETRAIKDEAGWAEFETLYQAANAITDDLDARYEAFAMVDAFAVSKALYIPSQMDTRGYVVTKIVPFTKQYSPVGLGDYKYVYMQVQEEMVTRAQYDEAYADFQANR